MKKHLTPLAIFIVLSATLYSQSFNLSVSGGYCLPIATELHPINVTFFGNPNVPNTYSVATQSVTPISYGNGSNVAFSMDWYSKVNIGFGLKFNAQFSAPVQYAQEETDLNYNTVNYNTTDKAYSYQFIPHLNFKCDFKKISPYIEMGMLIGITKINSSWSATDNAGDVETGSQNFYGGLMLGFYSSLGLSFKITNGVHFTLAMVCNAASYSPMQYKLTSLEFNGVNQISSIPASAQQGSFVKQANFSAGDEAKYSIPFSNIASILVFVLPCLTRSKMSTLKKRKPRMGFMGFKV